MNRNFLRIPRQKCGDRSHGSLVLLTSILVALLAQSISAFSNPRFPTQRLTKFSPTIYRHQTASVDSDPTNNSEEEEDDDKEDEEELLKRLDEKFAYEGRLPAKDDFRCGFVSILGAPNMGKSTLLNALLKEDLCVATRRPQTTRHAILGVLTTSDCQVCLVDTPGIIDNPAYKLQDGMMEAVRGAFYDSNAILVVTDLFSTPIPDDEIWEKICICGKPTIVVINKIDLVGRTNPDSEENQEEGRTVTVVDAVAKWRSLLPDALAILPVSASQGIDNLGVIALRKLLLGGDDLPAALRDMGRPIPGMFQQGVQGLTDDDAKALLPKSSPLYDEEVMTDRTERYVLFRTSVAGRHLGTSNTLAMFSLLL
jgi:small GTP-binding protein